MPDPAAAPGAQPPQRRGWAADPARPQVDRRDDREDDAWHAAARDGGLGAATGEDGAGPGARMLVDALTAPPTEHELAAEQQYVAAFLASRRGEPEASATGAWDGPSRSVVARLGPAGVGPRRRAVRIGVAAGVAFATFAGTAAALTGNLPVTARTPAPAPSSAPAVPGASEAPPSGGSRSSPAPGGSPTTGPTGSAGPAGGSAGPSAVAPPEGGAPTRGQGSTAGPRTASPRAATPGPTAGATSDPGIGPVPPTPVPTVPRKPGDASLQPQPPSDTRLARLCRAFERAKLRPDSPIYLELVAIAGSPERVPAVCRDVLAAQEDAGDDRVARDA